MLIGKVILYLTYVVFGTVIAVIYPWTRRNKLQNEKASFLFNDQNRPCKKNALLYLGIVIIVATSFLMPLHFVFASVTISFILSYQNRAWRTDGVVIFIGLVASSFLAFWLHDDHNRLKLFPIQTLQFFCITVIAYLVLISQSLITHTKKTLWAFKSLIYCFFIALAFYFSFDAKVNLATDSFYQWHHWSAYLGQAKLVASGAIPLNDIPVQYGSGPILLSAIGCKFDCWLSFYWIAASSSFLLTLVIGFISLSLSKPKSNAQICIVLIISLLASLFWPPYQNEILSITTFPSVSGLRFLPALLMLCVIFIYANSSKTILSPRNYAFYLFTLIWGFCVAWSPDAAIQASVVWLPYYFWTRISQAPHTPSKQLILSAILEIVISCALALFLLTLLFYYCFGEWPILNNYLLYLQSLPGAPEKINSNGLIWFAITITIFWICFAWSNPFHLTEKLIWLCGLLAYANFTYFLSHSHDSVMADLLPYFILILFGIYGASSSQLFRKVSSIILAAIIGWSSLMVGWPKILELANTNSQNTFTTFVIDSPKQLIANFDLEKSNPFSVVPRSQYDSLKSENLNSSIRYLHNYSPDPIEIFDQWLLIDSGEKLTPWSAFHGPITMLVLPRHQQKYFLERFSKKFPRSGWVVYDKDFLVTSSLEMIDKAYTRTEEIDFKYYRAIHFSPK